MSDALIASQNAEIARLNTKVADLNSAIKQARRGENGNDALRAKVTDLTTRLTAAETAANDWKAKAEAAPGDQAKRITELEGVLALRDHKDTFKAAGKKAGLKDESADDLYGLLALKPGDKPATADEFTAVLATAREGRPWAFGETPDSGQLPGAPLNKGTQAVNLGAPKAPDATGGRGATVTSASTIKYHRADVRKAGWQRANPALVKALADGTAVCLDA